MILDETFASVTFDEKLLLARVTWKDAPMTFENYKAAFTAALDFQVNNTVINYMSDIRKQKIVSPQFRKWFQEEAVPRAVKQGLKRGVVVFNGNVFKKYYLNNIMNTTKRFGLPFKFFNTEEKAFKWIDTQMKL